MCKCDFSWTLTHLLAAVWEIQYLCGGNIFVGFIKMGVLGVNELFACV